MVLTLNNVPTLLQNKGDICKQRNINFINKKKETMTKLESEFEMKKYIEAEMTRNEILEKENQELRQEVNRLKTHIASLKAHNIERKSILWKKIHNSMDGNNNSLDLNVDHEILQKKQPELSELLVSSVKVAAPPPPKVSAVAAPPPPPAPSKLLLGLKTVRRVPEVIELYRSLTRKEGNMENRGNSNGVMAVAFTRNMIEEIENRSTFLSAVS